MNTVTETMAKRINGYFALLIEFILLALNAYLIYYISTSKELVYLWGEIPLFILTIALPAAQESHSVNYRWIHYVSDSGRERLRV